MRQTRNAEDQLTGDLAALTRIHDLCGKMVEAAGMPTILQEAMDAAVAMVGARYGTLQLRETGSLRIVAQHGHRQPFLDFFAAAEAPTSAWGEAARRSERVIIEDVETSPLFAGTDSLDALRRAGVRAVQSTPLVTRGGRLLGVLTTEWAEPYRPDEHDLWRIDLLARQVSDLLEISRSEQAMRESEQRYRGIVETAEEGIVIHEPDGTIAYANRRMAEMLGCSPEEIVGRPSLEFLDDEQRATAVQARAHLEKGEGFSAERKLRRKDGSILWTLCNVNPRQDGQGGFLGYLAMHSDITERKRAEDAVQRERDRLSALIDSVTDEIWFADDRGKVTLVNPAAWEEFGAGLGVERGIEKIAASLEVYRPDGTPRPVDEAPPLRALRGEIVKEQEEIVRTPATGRLRHRQVNAAPVRGKDGAILGSVAVVRDVTERKRAEEKLRESEERLRRIVENSRDGINMLDLATGRYVFVSHRQVELTGFTMDEINGISAEEALERVHPEDRMVSLEQQRRVGAGLDPETVEYRWRVKSGEYRWFSDSRGLVRDAQGQPIALVGISRDITSQKLAEEKLREADRQKNEFIAVLSHELRNPMAAIRTGLSILERVPPGGEDARQAAAMIDRQFSHLTDLVDDLLDVTRIARNKITLKKESLEINSLLRRVLQDCRGAVEAGGLEFATRLGDVPVYVRGDPTRLSQVFTNLLVNAIDFTPSGGRIEVSAERDPDRGQVVVRVSDTGVGLKPETMSRLFEPFLQVETNLTRQGSGLGLGLALVKGLVELHGGQVAAASPGPGQGSEFTVRLPLDAKVQEERLDGSSESSVARRILLVEDNPDLADGLGRLLRLLGHEVTVALTGSEGLRMARLNPPEVLLCDIALPDIDGYEVARRFRAERDLADAFLVALTGYAQPEDLDRASAAGFDRHLAKPVPLAALQKVLATANLPS